MDSLKLFRLTYATIILALVLVNSTLQSWNVGFDAGQNDGYNQAMLEGKVAVECKFDQNCQQDYDRGFDDGLNELDCTERPDFYIEVDDEQSE